MELSRSVEGEELSKHRRSSWVSKPSESTSSRFAAIEGYNLTGAFVAK